MSTAKRYALIVGLGLTLILVLEYVENGLRGALLELVALFIVTLIMIPVIWRAENGKDLDEDED